jgi:hypothetical protein
MLTKSIICQLTLIVLIKYFSNEKFTNLKFDLPMSNCCRTSKIFSLFALCVLFHACNDKNHVAEERTSDSSEDVSRKYCASCHAFPEPDLLDKVTWINHTLPAMGHRFGIYNDRHRDSLIERGSAGRVITQLNIFPAEQTITDEDWAQIIRYYQEEAPERLELPSDTSSLTSRSPFEVIVAPFKIERPAVSAVTYDEKSKLLFVADCSRENFSSVTLLDASLKPTTSLGLPFPVSNMAVRKDTLYILMMGH